MANSCTVYFQAQCMFVFSRPFQFMYHANFMNGMFDDTPADTITITTELKYDIRK